MEMVLPRLRAQVIVKLFDPHKHVGSCHVPSPTPRHVFALPPRLYGGHRGGVRRLPAATALRGTWPQLFTRIACPS